MNGGGGGVVEDTVLKPLLEPFIFLLLPWNFQRKHTSTPGIQQNSVRSLGNSKAKTKDPIYLVVTCSTLEIPFRF